MRARQLNRRIEIVGQGVISDGFAGTTAVNVVQREVWASIKPMSAQRGQLYGLDDLTHMVEIIVRANTNFDFSATNYFVRFKNQNYKVQQIIDLDVERTFLKLVAVKQQEQRTIAVAVEPGQGFPLAFPHTF